MELETAAWRCLMHCATEQLRGNVDYRCSWCIVCWLTDWLIDWLTAYLCNAYLWYRYMSEVFTFCWMMTTMVTMIMNVGLGETQRGKPMRLPSVKWNATASRTQSPVSLTYFLSTIDSVLILLVQWREQHRTYNVVLHHSPEVMPREPGLM